MKSKRLIHHLLITSAFFGFLLFARDVSSFEFSGRFATDMTTYGSRISTLNNNNASFKLYATLKPVDALDASIIINAEQRSYFNHSNPQDYRIRRLYYRHAYKTFEISIGRQYVTEATGTNLDGVKLRMRPKAWIDAGVFAGMKANPYLGSIQKGYTTFGIFSTVRKGSFNARASYTSEYYQGILNRAFLVCQSGIRYKSFFRLNNNLTIDTDQSMTAAQLTNAYVNAYVAPHKRVNFSLGYSRYQPYKQLAFNDLFYRLNYYPSHRYMFRSSVTVTRWLNLGVSRRLMKRDYDHARTHTHSFEMSSNRVLISRLRGHLRYSQTWGDIYGNTAYSTGGTYMIGGRHSVNANYSRQFNKSYYAGLETSGHLVKISFFSSLVKNTTFGISYSYNDSWGSVQSGMFTHIAYKF